MRTWQRSAIACTTSPVVSSIRSRASSSGAAAYGSGDDVADAKQVGHGGRPAASVPAAAPGRSAKKSSISGMRLLAAVEAPPGAAQAPDQFVAGVDRNEVALRAVAARARRDQERLDVRASTAQRRVRRDDRLPGGQRQLGLGRPGRARVERDRAAQHRVAEEEGHADRDLQLVPARLSRRKRGKAR